MRWGFGPCLVMMLALLPCCGSTAEEACVEACELNCPERGCEYCSDYAEGAPCTDEAKEAYECEVDVLEEVENVCEAQYEPCFDAFVALEACEQPAR